MKIRTKIFVGMGSLVTAASAAIGYGIYSTTKYNEGFAGHGWYYKGQKFDSEANALKEFRKDWLADQSNIPVFKEWIAYINVFDTKGDFVKNKEFIIKETDVSPETELGKWILSDSPDHPTSQRDRHDRIINFGVTMEFDDNNRARIVIGIGAGKTLTSEWVNDVKRDSFIDGKVINMNTEYPKTYNIPQPDPNITNWYVWGYGPGYANHRVDWIIRSTTMDDAKNVNPNNNEIEYLG